MKRVVIIGSGNVATSLAHGLAACCEVAQIYSRQLSHAQALATAVGCSDVTDDL
ncbi:MAG: NAD(P)-binding domain-containing protein, partial [Muribaculaceae bacterium]|nr:NAD(P)-binding domain-containing protein [Muribaculaceae bacterium]